MELVAIIHKSRKTYGISFPDVPGCISAGGSESEVIANGMEALDFHLEHSLGVGIPLPVPRSLEALLADPEYEVDFKDNYKVVTVPFPPAVRAGDTAQDDRIRMVTR